MKNLKPINAPMSTSTNLDADPEGKMVYAKQFRGMIGSLLYLTSSRPDIQFCVCLCVRFQACPKKSHFAVVKRIFRYLVGTKDIGLWYPAKCNLDSTLFTKCDNKDILLVQIYVDDIIFGSTKPSLCKKFS